MNFFGASVPTKKTVVRKVSVQVPTKQLTRPAPTPQSRPSPATKATPKASKTQHLEPPQRKTKSLVKRVAKRKASTPPPQWDDDDDDSGAEDSDLSFDSSRKRIRSSASSVDPSRRIGDTSKQSEKDGGIFTLAHGADLVAGEQALKYTTAFVEEVATEVDLQYPSASQRERFYLAQPKNANSNDYNPMDDIRETIKFISRHYLPEDEATAFCDEDKGYERRLIRAMNHGSREEYTTAIQDFNAKIKARQADGTIERTLSLKHGLELSWVERILDQTYSRTVSPHVESLREYENGTDYVYGELNYPLVSEMFKETALRSDQVFVDLGSGVGNVVLQAALEIGCESWGCEYMKNPCELAELQAKEFRARARLWGLSVGDVHLKQGDFLDDKATAEALKRADVVLINNQAFGPDLNSRLVDKFLDLKDGCRIVSLKSFKPDGLEISERNMDDMRHLLRVVKKEYFSNSVSWTSAPGNYYIATKDPAELIKFRNRSEKRSRK